MNRCTRRTRRVHLHPSELEPDGPVVYIAGPMMSLPQYNFQAFDEMKEKLEELGYVVYSPADVSRNFGVNELDPEQVVTPADVQQLMRVDLLLVMEADMVLVLPGWERSRGARCEARVAQAIGTPVVDHEMKLVDLSVLDEAIS